MAHAKCKVGTLQMGKKKRRELKVLAENRTAKKKKVTEPRFKPKQGLPSQTPRLAMGE